MPWFITECPAVCLGFNTGAPPVCLGFNQSCPAVCLDFKQECPAEPKLPQQLLRGCLAAFATAALVTVAPLDAQAVSGGGGISQPLSEADLSNQDLTKRSFTKAVLRKTNFSKSNLTGGCGLAWERGGVASGKERGCGLSVGGRGDRK